MSRPGRAPSRRGELSRTDLEALAGVAVAAAGFAPTFRGPPPRFWDRMTATGLALGGLALAADPELRRIRPRPRHLVEGAAIAAVLYGVFQVGDVMARRVMPDGAGDIDAIYELRSGQDARLIAARLAAVIGPAEELFWRGFLQRRLGRNRGRAGAWALASAAYGGVHLSSGNPTLVGAASVAGAYWSALAAAGVAMESLIVSHVIWDIVIFLVAPTTRRG
ncbi:MAG TPA: CPBP family intramembrane glutamic endopeptidase [Acidimicrobiales bacterium]|nr:CPBP family intramembrane glutamic endopeptidase [Acidimicrobiales bacterium]